MSERETAPKKGPPPPVKETTTESEATSASDNGSRSRSQSRRARRRKQTAQQKKQQQQMPVLDEQGEANEDETGAVVRLPTILHKRQCKVRCRMFVLTYDT